MIGADPGELVAGAFVDPFGERAVLLRAQRLAHPAVGDVADQHVLEAKCPIARDGRALLGDDELALEQPVEQRIDLEAGHEPVERTAPEHPADQRGGLEHALLTRLQPVDPGGDQGLNAVGDAVELLVLPEHAGDLLEEQRVALRPLEHERPLGGRHLGSCEQRIGESAALGRVERPELDRARAANAAAPGGARVEQVRARDRDDQHRDVAERPGEMLDQVEQRLLRPVHVLEDEDERLQLGELLGPAQRRPGQLRRRVLALGRAEHPERHREQVGHRFALAGEAQLLEGVVRRVVVGDPRARLDHRGERPVGHALAVGQRSPGQRRHALERVGELGHEARLADAELAEDGDELHRAIPHRPLKGVLQERQLRLAADERRRGEPRRIVHPHGAPRPERLVPALDLERPGALDLDRACREPSRALAEQDLARLGRLLQAHGEVHGLARGKGRLGVLDDDLAGFDADPDAEPQRLDLGDDLERRPQCALRVVLVCDRHAERRHDRVAGELLDGSAMLGDRPGDALEIAVHASAHDLRIGARHESGRAHQIDEHDRRNLAFHVPTLPAARGLPEPSDGRQGRSDASHTSAPIASATSPSASKLWPLTNASQ